MDKDGNYREKLPLHREILYGRTERVRALIDAGEDINSQESIIRETPLMVAVSFNQTESIALLINAGADVDIQALEPLLNGRTASHLASFDINIEGVRALIDAGADVNIRDNSENTPLHLALGEGTALNTRRFATNRNTENKDNDLIELVKALLVKGANPNAQNNNGETPLDILRRNEDDIYTRLKESLMEILTQTSTGRLSRSLIDAILYCLITDLIRKISQGCIQVARATPFKVV